MKLIIANWKSNHNLNSTQNWFESFASLVQQKGLLQDSAAEVVISPPYPVLSIARHLIKALGFSRVQLGTQGLSQFGSGAYTGAVAAENLEGLGLEYCLVGHSERRRFFAETDEVVAQKVEQAIQHNLTPVLCLDKSTIGSQADYIDESYYSKLVTAFEPTEAIGSGHNAEASEVETAVHQIKQVYGDVPVLYGGSVNAENIEQYLEVCSGVLVGGASLKASSFVDLIEVVERPDRQN